MRRGTLLLGGIVLATGLLALVAPGAIDLGNPDVVLIGAAMLAILAGLVVANNGYKTPRIETQPPSVESPSPVPVAGETIEELLRYADAPYRYVRERRTVRQRARELAVDVLQTFDGMSSEAATAAIEEGSWTENPVARRFLGAIERNRSLRRDLRHRVLGPPSISGQFAATLEAIAEHVPGWSDSIPHPEGERRFRLAAVRAGVEPLRADAGETDHWRGISVVALLAIGAGVIAELAPLLFGGIVGAAYVGYSRLGGPPAIDVAVDRTVTPEDPRPGDTVRVEVRIENRGDSLVDLRLIDGVPESLAVADGSARKATVLRAGDATTLEYACELTQGRHTWESMLAIARSLNGSFERQTRIDATTVVTARPLSQPISERVPLRTTGAMSVGQLPSDRAGEGVEFQSVRGYRPGDRRTRIDWRRYARFGELSTVEFREERATSVVIVVDAREDAYLAPAAEAPHAVEYGTETADRLGVTLLQAGHRVGLASLAPDPCWLAPRAERGQRARLSELLTTHDSFSFLPPEAAVRTFSWVEWFGARIPGDAQVVLLSPLCDDMLVEIIVRIEARGHPVTVISPDLTGTATLGGTILGMERAVRIAKLRRRGVTVVDWTVDQPLDAQLLQLAGHWP